jgi:hypothetical protein
MTSYILCGNTFSIAAMFPGVNCGQILLFSGYVAKYLHLAFFFILFDREEMAIDEAELEPREMAEKLHAQQILQEQVTRHLHYVRVVYKLLITWFELVLQQLNMLVEMRKCSPESQSVILGNVCTSSPIPISLPLDSNLTEVFVYFPVIHVQLRKQLEEANFDINASILSPEQIQEIIQK